MDDLKQIWNLAIASYEEQTKHKLGSDSRFAKFTNLQQLEQAVHTTETRFTAFRKEGDKVFKNLKKCIVPLLPIMNVVQTALGGTPYAPATVLLGAASYLLEACNKVSSSYDATEALLEEVSSITARMEEYARHGIGPSLQVKMAQILACILEVMGSTEKAMQRKRIKEWTRVAFLRNDEISELVSKLERLTDSELGLVTALTYSRVGDLQRDTKEQLKQVLDNQRSDRKHGVDAADERIKQALSSETVADLIRRHNQNLESLTEGTGVWLRDDAMFTAWEREAAPILWIFGRPGVGKTMLATRTVERLQREYSQKSDVLSLASISYLYFKDDNPNLQDCSQMLKAAALQITQVDDRFRRHVLACLPGLDALSTTKRVWQNLFLDFFRVDTTSRMQSSLAFLIVDGLDEAPKKERVQFLACLAELASQSTHQSRCRIQVAIFARPDVRADIEFDSVRLTQQERIIEVTPDRNSEDIDAFIKQKMSSLPLFRKMKALKAAKSSKYRALAKEIHASVKAGSQGMFLWASLIFDQISGIHTPEGIRSSLTTAPKGLDDMLHQVFQRLDANEEAKVSYLKHLLYWVFYAHRPLKIAELFVLLQLSAKQHCLMLEEDLRDRYSSLFTVTGPTVRDMAEDSEPAQVLDEENAETTEVEVDEWDFLDNGESGHTSVDDDSHLADQQSSTTSDEASNAEASAVRPHWHQAVVSIAHAGITEYIRTEIDPETRRWNDCTIFSGTANEAKVQIVITCLQILSTNVTQRYGTDELKEYVCRKWMKHLVSITVQKGSVEAIQIAKFLATLFHDGEKTLAWSRIARSRFSRIWFGDDRYTNAVRTLVAENVEHLDEDVRPWALKVTASFRPLFHPLVRACSEKWLTKTDWHDEDYCHSLQFEVLTLCAYNTLTDQGPTRSKHFPRPSRMSAKEIVAAAELEKLPKTEHWYTGVAMTLMETKHESNTHLAIRYFQKALELSPNEWAALDGLATCYGNKLRDYRMALSLMNDAIRGIPPETVSITFYLTCKMGTWQLELDDPQEAIRVARLAFEQGRQFFDWEWNRATRDAVFISIKSYIEALYRTKAFAEIILVIAELDERFCAESPDSLWIRFIQAQWDDPYDVDLFDKIGRISGCEEHRRAADLIRYSFERAADFRRETVREPQNHWLALKGATLLYHRGLWEDCRRFCANIIKVVIASDGTGQRKAAELYQRAIGLLGFMYLADAMSARRAGIDLSSSMSTLRSAAMNSQDGQQDYRATDLAMALGLWMREIARDDEAAWMAAIKPSLLEALNLLSDDDPCNDQDAYGQLGAALLYANDVENAQVALGIAVGPLDEAALPREQIEAHKDASVSRQETSDGPIAERLRIKEKYIGFGLKWSCDGICDGICDTTRAAYAELHFCRFCRDTCFCERCILLLQQGRLRMTNCSKDHEHVQMYPVTDRARQIIKGLRENRDEEQILWLDELKRRWGVSA